MDSPSPPTAPPIVVDVVTTIDDQLEFNEWLRAQPELRWGGLTIAAAVVASGAPFVLAIGSIAWWLTDLDRGGPLEMLRSLSATDWARFGTTCLLTILLIGVLALAATPLRRPYLCWQLRRQLAERAGVDPHDPERRERTRCTIDERGYAARSDNVDLRVEWRVVRELAETPNLLLLRTGTTIAYLLPKRALSPEQVAGIRALVARFAGGRGPWDRRDPRPSALKL